MKWFHQFRLYSLMLIDTAMRPAFLAALILGSAPVCLGQVRATSEGQESTFDGRYVTVRFNEDRGRQGYSRAPVNRLDVKGAKVCPDCNGGPMIMLNCLGGAKCFTNTMRNTGLTIRGEGERSESGGTDTSDYNYITCSSVSECEAFLNALKESVTAEAGRTREARQGASREAQPTDTSRNSNPAPVPAPAIQPLSPPNAAFRDILSGVPWRNGASGKSVLDQLAAKTEPTPNKTARPPAQRPTFAAFAQAGGFNANSGWGAATGADLNSVIGQANAACVNRAGTTCDDQGYCMLRPGLWGAWASDLKYLGNKSFACNFKTEAEARSQAQAWCGYECKVLWVEVAQ